MRKIIPFFWLLFFAVANKLPGQPVLYGLTSGGEFGGGTISKFETGNGSVTVAFAFKNDPKFPTQSGDPIQAKDGKLYGMTDEGGNHGTGIIFSFDPVTNTFIKIHDFDGVNGGFPSGSVVQAVNGKLYGVTHAGGSNGYGTIFSFDPITNGFNKLHDFNSTNGRAPYGSLVQADNGRLYGMTYEGGSNGYGTIFSIDPVTNAFSKLHDFNSINGSAPFGSLVQAGNGKLYGMTYGGGSNGYGYGTIFSFDPNTNGFNKLHDFNSTNGRSPYGNLVEAGNGKLYGMTNLGGTNGVGTIFSFDPATGTHIKLHDFNRTNGSLPYHNCLVRTVSGKLYGMTYGGGSGGYGTIFSFDPATNLHNKLHDFNDTNGRSPRGSLVQAVNGKLYGMTYLGGSSAYGTIFSFDPAVNTLSKLHDFSNPNGSFPRSALVQAGNGKVYGMTGAGGNFGNGTIFSFDPVTNIQNKLHDFNNLNGGSPRGGLVQASDGRLYGMTYGGGSSGVGTIFSFDPVDNTFSKLHDFNSVNGSYPYGSLVEAGNGKLYGMTHEGGSSDAGTIFSFDPPSNTFTKLHDFFSIRMTSAGGSFPYGSLVLASNGKLYGMTNQGGMPMSDDYGITIYGTIFSFDPVANIFNKLHEFDMVNGSSPYGDLVQASDDKLYGMTYGGGGSGNGTIFSFEPGANTFSKLHDFNTTSGWSPSGSLVEASDGKLYGITSRGGSSGQGTIFSFDPTTSTYNKLQDYNNATGLYPTDGTLIEVNACARADYFEDRDKDGYGNPAVTTKACAAPPGYVADSTDCNDSSAVVHPGATEICNGIDDDCDGQIDEAVKTIFYADADGDGYGNPAVTVQACAVPPGYIADNTDCNDSSAAAHPGATEVCNSIDDDCDGETDEGLQTTFYADSDADGYGNADITTQSCSKPAGYVTDNLDCDDNNSSIHPGAPEVAGNNIDDDCNGVRDEGRIVLWPNPARQVVNLRIFDATLYGKLEVDMVDKNGRMVKQWMTTYTSAGEVLELQLGDLAGGIYIVIIKANNGSQLTYKLAVLH